MYAIAGTRNAKEGIKEAIAILEEGGSAIDAVESAIKVVERNEKDWSVGFNGFPNLLGEVELDASIMVGSTRRAGAVAAVKKYLHVISLARKVMELSPHVLLVGEGAEKFAAALGWKQEPLIEEYVLDLHHKIIKGEHVDIDTLHVPEEIRKIAWRYDSYLKKQLEQFDYSTWYYKLKEPWHGTVNVIALDKNGELCAGVSTSGLALKFPGRAGDSPLIGAGNYADQRFGAATCVGVGELAIRINAARSVVLRLEFGMPLQEALRETIKEIYLLDQQGPLQILGMTPDGKAAAVSTNENLYYWYASETEELKDYKTEYVKE